MGENVNPYKAMRRRRWALVLIAALIPVLVLGYVALFNRWYLSPEIAVDAFTAQDGLPVTNAVDTTDEVCGPRLRCRAALKADELSIYQFWFRKDAREFADSLGSAGHQSDWIVLSYEGAGTSDPSELSYAGIIDGMWTSQ
jgi:hypothetical protein